MGFHAVSKLPGAVRSHLAPFIAVLLTGVVLIAIAAVRIRPNYSASADVLMVGGSANSSTDKSAGASTPILSKDLASIATSASVLKAVKDRANLQEDLPAVRSHVRAKVSIDSQILVVGYRSHESGQAVALTNMLADEVASYYRRLSTTRFDSLIRDLEGQLNNTNAQLAEYDRQLAKTADTYPYVDSETPSNPTSSVNQRLIALTTQRDDLISTIRSEESSLAASKLLADNARPQAERDLVENNTVYSNLHAQYAKDLQSLKHMQSYASDNYPGLAELTHVVNAEAADVERERAKAVKGNLSSNVAYANAMDTLVRSQSQLEGDRSKLETVRRQLSALSEQLGNGSVALTASKARRDRQNAETTYAQLAARLADARANRAQAAATGSLVVINRAAYASPEPLSSGKTIGVLIAVVFVWLACSLALYLESAAPQPGGSEASHGETARGNAAKRNIE